jgi:hypothetical protein
MANMSAGDRGSFERATIGNETSFRPRDGSRRGTTITFLILLVILVALSAAMIAAIDGWAHIIVIADLVLIVGALAFFISGRREQAPPPPTSTEDEGWRPWGNG